MLRIPGRNLNVIFLFLGIIFFRFFCFPCPIGNKAYPFVFAVVSACIVGFRLDIFLCICLGYAATRLVMIEKIMTLQPEFAQKYDWLVKKTHLYGKWTEPPVEPAETLDNTPSKNVTNIVDGKTDGIDVNNIDSAGKDPKNEFVIDDMTPKKDQI